MQNAKLTLVFRWSSAGATPLGTAHALVLALYGFRLNAFLLYRELTIDRFKKFVEKIEDKANTKGGRLSRVPFILSCGFLYFCMAAPLFITAQAPPSEASLFLTALAWGGFGVAAMGDLIKTEVKGKEGEDTLVTSGPFSILRHPNYTGCVVARCQRESCAMPVSDLAYPGRCCYGPRASLRRFRLQSSLPSIYLFTMSLPVLICHGAVSGDRHFDCGFRLAGGFRIGSNRNQFRADTGDHWLGERPLTGTQCGCFFSQQ